MKKCLNCETELIGRIDKKFCDEYCKSAYNYVKDKNKPKTRFQTVDDQLRLNRKILKKYNQGGKVTVRREKLINDGFNPRIFTNYFKTKDDKVYLFCYDYGFLEIEDNSKQKYLLVEWQDYMKT